MINHNNTELIDVPLMNYAKGYIFKRKGTRFLVDKNKSHWFEWLKELANKPLMHH